MPLLQVISYLSELPVVQSDSMAPLSLNAHGSSPRPPGFYLACLLLVTLTLYCLSSSSKIFFCWKRSQKSFISFALNQLLLSCFLSFKALPLNCFYREFVWQFCHSSALLPCFHAISGIFSQQCVKLLVSTQTRVLNRFSDYRICGNCLNVEWLFWTRWTVSQCEQFLPFYTSPYCDMYYFH